MSLHTRAGRLPLYFRGNPEVDCPTYPATRAKNIRMTGADQEPGPEYRKPLRSQLKFPSFQGHFPACHQPMAPAKCFHEVCLERQAFFLGHHHLSQVSSSVKAGLRPPSLSYCFAICPELCLAESRKSLRVWGSRHSLEITEGRSVGVKCVGRKQLHFKLS